MFEFVDDSFIRENSHENILSIQVNLNGFSFCIHKGVDNKLLYFKQLQLKISSNHLLVRRLDDWCKEEELLLLPYREKHVYYVGYRFSLVPEQLESEALKSDIRTLVMSANEEEEYAENWIEEIKAKLVFMIPDQLNNILHENIGDYRLKHVVKKLISISHTESSLCNLLVFFDEKEMIVLAKKNKQLIFCNNFRINHVNDVVYYILTIAKQLQIDLKNSTLQISGKSDFIDGAKQDLSQHFVSITKAIQNTEDRISESNVAQSVCLF